MVRTILAGVIGWPIEHSVSPAMHNAAFAALGIDGRYLAFAVRPDQVGEAILGVRALGLRGVNVTVPHKHAVLSLVDELTPEAARIGAVNTVLVREWPSPPAPLSPTPWERGEEETHSVERGAPGPQWVGCGTLDLRISGESRLMGQPSLLGHNTDAGGFLAALREAGFEPRGCRALVLGAGGAARAVVYALASVGAQVVILNRHPERASALAREFATYFPLARLSAEALGPEALERVASGAELVVNATSLGMAPAIETTPWPEEAPFPAGGLLFDLVYNPRETRFMRQAQAAGARALDGLRMLIYQGAEAFELWTGMRPPVDVMLQACIAVLGGQ
jgi:shikimate dehydrogenase